MDGNICPWWLAYTFDNPFRRFFHSPEKIFGPYAADSITVLDVGCGMGFFSIGLAKLVGDRGCVIAADVQKKKEKSPGINLVTSYCPFPGLLKAIWDEFHPGYPLYTEQRQRA